MIEASGFAVARLAARVGEVPPTNRTVAWTSVLSDFIDS